MNDLYFLCFILFQRQFYNIGAAYNLILVSKKDQSE